MEQILAIKWEAEQEEMRRRRDPRKVMCISSTRVRELDAALARVPQGVYPDAAAERQLLQIFKDLPPDRALWVSHKVVRYEDHRFQMSQFSANEGSLDQAIERAIRKPDAVRRAAARMKSYCAECDI